MFNRYSSRFFSVSMLDALICTGTFAQTTHKIPFTPAGIRSIIGKNVCQFSGWRFFEGDGVYLDFNKTHSVDYKVHEGVGAVFLLSKPTDHCGIVDAVLDVTRLTRKGEGVEFKCYTAHEGGTTWPKWGHIIGLANNDNGIRQSPVGVESGPQRKALREAERAVSYLRYDWV